MKCRWLAPLALLATAPACTHIETIFLPSEPGHRGSLSSRPVGTVEVVSGKYVTDPPLFCAGGRCGDDRLRVVGFFKIENAHGASDEQLLKKLVSEAAAAGCEVLDVYPPFAIDRAGILRGRPRGGTCLLAHKVSRFHDLVGMLPWCAAGQTGVTIDGLSAGDGKDRVVAVRGVLTYDQTDPSCDPNNDLCGCCHECSLPLVLADPGPRHLPPLLLMDGGDDATRSLVPGTDSQALGIWFNECERGYVVRNGDRAEVIATGVLRQLGPSKPEARWAMEAPSLCVVAPGKTSSVAERR